MKVDKKNADTLQSGRKRVRLGKVNGHKGRDRSHMEKMWKARDESFKKAPRSGRGKGKIVHAYSYKKLLEIAETSDSPPRIIERQNTVDPKTATNLPLFLQDPQIEETIVDLISRGHFPSTVCRYVGIRLKTFKTWLRLGAEEASPDYIRFQRRVAKADAMAEINKRHDLERDSIGDWRGHAFVLERRWGENWMKSDGGGVKVDVNVNKKEDVAAAIVNDKTKLELARKLLTDESSAADSFTYSVSNEKPLAGVADDE
jgi:hypothetical protein